MPLTNAQYDELMREYNRRQIDNVHRQRERIQEIYEKLPQVRELEEETASLGIRCAREAAQNGSVSSSLFREESARIRKKRDLLLERSGYPSDYLDLHYHCDLCRDTGYVNGQRCRCFLNAAIDLFYTQSGLRRVLEEENFSRFSFDFYPTDIVSNATGRSARENMHYIVSDCRSSISRIDTQPCHLLFYGATGLGKTFLSHCLAKDLLDNAHSVLYYSAPSLFDELADIRFSRNQDESGNPSYIYDCDFLIIDDLGTELTNAFTASALFLILNERIARKKSTLISTNLMLQDLSVNYSERVFSRISSHFRLYEFFGDDIRIKMQLSHSSHFHKEN